MGTPISPRVRFMNKVVEQANGCWYWSGTTAGSHRKFKRPTFQPGTRSTDPKVYAARWIYEQDVGTIPAGLELDHAVCSDFRCVNPAHMEPVTHEENMRRARLTLCRSGRHDLTVPENVRWDSDGRRRGCYLCWREKSYASARARREKRGGQ